MSTDASARPGTYLIQRDRADLVGPWLKAIGEPLWLDAWEAYRTMLPPGWQTTYVGVFPGRADGLLRVNAHPVGSGAAGLDRAISSLGLLADEDSLALCSELLCGVRGLDLQLDIDGEGRPAPDFALEAYLESVPHFPSPWESGAGERILSLMEAHGAADDRWRALEDVDVSRCVALPTQEGMRSCAVSLRTFSAKVRFLGGRPVLAKAYLRGDASIASASNGAAVYCDAGNGSFGNGWSSSSDGMLLPESRMSEVSNSSSGCSSFR